MACLRFRPDFAILVRPCFRAQKKSNNWKSVYKKCNSSIALSYNFLVLFIEFCVKSYMESWGQTWGISNFDLQVQSVPASVQSPPGRKIEIHNSNRSVHGRSQRILRWRLYRVLLSRYFYHGLHGQLCPEYFQKGPRNFGFFLRGGQPLPRSCREFFFSKIFVLFNLFGLLLFGGFCLGHFLFLGIERVSRGSKLKKKLLILWYGFAASFFFIVLFFCSNRFF